ncbi:MAG: PKD domain-containing protein [Flavobacteriales bacterium]|nr:PKD domain-containing protein [Flavobacteriales bacterium]
MSNFEDIIKNKIEQFDVPYNEANWVALDKKLTSIKRVKTIKNVIASSAGVLIVALAAFVIYNNNDATTNKKEHETSNESNNQNATIISAENQIQEETKTSTIQLEKESKPVDETSTKNEETTNTTVPKSLIKSNEPSYNKVATPIVVENITAEFIAYNNKVCLGEEVSFEAVDKKDLLSYTWNFGDGNSSTKLNPKHVYKQAGNYTVELKVVNKRTGEEYKTTQRNIVTINPLPNTDFTYTEKSTQFDDNKLKYPYTYFNYLGESTDNCTWIFSNGKNSKANNPVELFDKKGDYSVTLTSKNKFGCSESITKTVNITTPFELFAPTAFTPNFDGNNDAFLPEALTTWDVKFEMVIKNKQGNLIYKTSDKNSPWVGSLNNQGAILDNGVYFWQIVTYDFEGNPHQHIGKITLMK